MTDYNESPWDDDNETESKTRRKQRMTELQKMGAELMTLNKRQLDLIDLPENLLSAMREYQRLPNRHEAKRRQMQFIGKLMRAADHDAIREALDKLRAPDRQEMRRAQQIEAWGERLLQGDDETVEAFLAEWQHAERQPLRQLLRNCTDAGVKPLSASEETGSAKAAMENTPEADSSSPAVVAARKARRRLFDYLGQVIV
ncbi:ribosome biogenesis factor YjgA [Pseudohongiella sp. SYSU M77423]|uniref:ribosome biogenesis factor YjgA n=1 Tax=Pseudohongiella sp. SYSU M77423 TaxID=3042312 RepID=UPI002480110E|nr:ribosome biogenesis factor YjgA [Pseudohongiella sp. SYSU M77423]MDH7944617.1 ribosome biogenesis factor YjgA [Pseudohongiella sp. SYSU M77423]